MLAERKQTDAVGDPFSKSGLGVGRKDWLEGAAPGLKREWGKMMRHWEDVSKEEKKITVRNMEGKSLQVEGVSTVSCVAEGKGAKEGQYEK